MTIRIGGVHYGVGTPLLLGLHGRDDVEVVRETPRSLIDDLRAGSLQAALASSIEAYREPGYRAPAHLGIACRGPARSVRAFLRTPPGQVRTVGLDTGSESSVALLKILLQQRFGAGECSFSRIEPTLTPDDLDFDAVLLIGDAGFAAAPGPRQVIDLGEAWYSWTGLPFVFAIWLIAPHADPGPLLPILDAGYVAAEVGQDGTGGAIHYRLGMDDIAGLQRFHREAAALGLCDPQIQPELLGQRRSG